ncbi:hypothetical protein ACH35V_09750 [Actinomadura sp. 1N219]|uniref:hypothetical protein n=1 Tax=Actinomadura sp. 1N219 TaxID=3375152 RepID=UPI00378BB6B6
MTGRRARRGPVWQLLRIGRAAGRGTPGDRVRFWALLTASALLALAMTGALATMAMYEGRDHREQARAPQVTERARGAVASLRQRYDTVGDRQVTVVDLVPLGPAAPPPPGLARWPAPGEAFLSPELARSEATEHVKARYGRFAGRIAADGLASPAERFAYVRPLVADTRGWDRIRGFGGGWLVYGEGEDVQPLSAFLLTLAALTGLPAAALAVVAARTGSAARDRRTALLQAIGGGWRHRALVNIGEAAIPAALGAVLGTFPYLAVMAGNPRLPVTRYIISGTDLRGWAWALPMITVAVVVAVLAIVVALNRVGRDGRGTRPRSFSAVVPRWRLVLFGVAIAGVVISPYVHGSTSLFLYVGATAGMWATLPSAAAVAVRRFGARLGDLARSRGRVAPLVAGRWTAAHPGVVVRLAVALIIGLGLITQAQIWTSRLGDPAEEARATQQRIGDRLQLVTAPRATGPQVDDFVARLGDGFHVLELRQTAQGALLRAPCPVLSRFALGCPSAPGVPSTTVTDRRVLELIRWHASDRPPMVQAVPRITPPKDGDGALAVLADRHRQNWRVKQTANATFSTPDIQRLGENWLIGAANHDALAGWLAFLSSLGIVVLLVTAAFSAAAEFLRFGPALGPLVVHTGSARVFLGVALWNLAIPLMISAGIAAVVSIWHGLFFIAAEHAGTLSWSVQAAALTGAAAIALLIGVAGGISAARQARRWRPAAD